MADISDLISREEAAKRLEALAEQREGSFSGEAFEFAAKVVRGVPSAVRWIPVTDRLPEIGQRILVYCESKTIRKHVTSCTYMGDYLGHKQFTHWMPLPEPPKGE